MALIEFKNLPDTSTPITAQNLNNNFNYLDGEIPDVLNTQSNSTTDTYSCDYANGCNTYSTNEINTGKTWIDSKPIYRKVITFERNNHDTFNFSTPANYQKIIFMDAYCQDGDNNRFGLYYKDDTDCFRFYIHSSTIFVIVGSTYPKVNFSGYFIIEYTKTTD